MWCFGSAFSLEGSRRQAILRVRASFRVMPSLIGFAELAADYCRGIESRRFCPSPHAEFTATLRFSASFQHSLGRLRASFRRSRRVKYLACLCSPVGRRTL